MQVHLQPIERPQAEEPVLGEPTTSLWERVRQAVVSAGSEAGDALPLPNELVPLERLLRGLTLTGDPVANVAVARGKRPTRYDGSAKRLLVSTKHSVVAALMARSEDANAQRLLAAHALAEINRSLGEVTDADEQRALIALLEER